MHLSPALREASVQLVVLAVVVAFRSELKRAAAQEGPCS
jgi:hypothetical protein